jgi:sarcosine oxidase, subunit beta
MSHEHDVIVVGAGILGAATAHHILSGQPQLSVLLIDRDGVAQGNTSKSVAMVRDTFTSPPSHALAYASIEAYKHMHEAVGGGIGLNRMMYLWLFTEKRADYNARAIRRLRSEGVDVELLDADTLHDCAPCMALVPDDEESVAYGIPPIHSGLLCRNCFAVDPVAIAQHYVNAFTSAGGETRYGAEVENFARHPLKPLRFEGEEVPGQPFPSQAQKIDGVRLTTGETLRARTTILATGAWSRQLTDKLGRGSLLSPKKRQWFYLEGKKLATLFDLPGFGNEDGTLPFTVLPQGIYMKPSREGGFYLAFADDIGREISLDTAPERDYLVNCIHPFVKGYFPAFASATLKAMDAGSYCYDEVYRTPIVDWIHEGIMLVSGASGSGIMKADAIGRVAARRHELGCAGHGRFPSVIELPGNVTLDTEDLTIRGRSRIEPEQLVI